MPMDVGLSMSRSHTNGSRLRLKAEVAVHGIPESLLATQIPLSRLHGDMSQQELHLPEFSSGLVK
jgi:hypothetical protein